MKKAGLLLSLLLSTTCFSQTIKITTNQDNSKYRFEKFSSDSALTGFIYSKIVVFDNGYFACTLADSSIKKNCTLLDNTLKPIIPIGQFSEIILSEDANYATVAGEEYTLRLKESLYDTTTYTRTTKSWGVYDLKKKKLILPIKYNYLSRVYKDGIIVFNSGGVAFMNDNFGQGGQFGIINLKGEIVCKPQFTYIGAYNDKEIALAVIGGNNLDGINDGDYIAINKKGENIKPNFYIEQSPSVMKVYVLNDQNQNVLYVKEVEQLLGFKNETDTLTRDSLFNAKYMSNFYQEEFSEYTADGYENIVSRTSYDIYERDSRIDKWQPLPSNLKYYYHPQGSPVKNWGKYLQYKTNAPQEYQVFVDTVNLQIASFYRIDSIYMAEYDSLELDFMYPGIYSQNKKVLDKKYCYDVRTGKALFEKLDEQGFVFLNSVVDTVTYRYKLICDTSENKITICSKCYSDEAQFAWKYFIKKHMGFLVNEEVVLPPIYNYIIALNTSEYLLLDSINNLWNYNLRSNTLTRSDLSFDKIVNKRVNSEDSPFTQPALLLAKNKNKEFVSYNIARQSSPVIFDSASVMMQASGIDPNGNEVVYTSYQELTSLYQNYEDIMVFRNDSAFSFNIRENSMAFKDIMKNLFYYGVSSSKLELVHETVTFKKVRYQNHYYQGGYYLLQTAPKKYVYYNSTFVTANSIKADSVDMISPYLIYWNNKKMYMADITKKVVLVQNKKVEKYFITLLDSAKQLSLIDENTGEEYGGPFYSNSYHDLYKADGVYKSISSKKVVKYTPTNLTETAKEEVLMYVYQEQKGYVLGRTDYIITKNNMKYLCALRNAEIKKDGEVEDRIIEFRDKYYEVLDSAKVFNIPKVKDKYDCKYDIRGTYRADGILKSATTNKKLPVQMTDSIIAFSSNTEEVEVFAFCKNGKWKVLCVNMVNPEEFLILDDYVFNSYQELLKTLRPYQVSSIECDIKTPAKMFDKTLSALDKKVMDGVPWSN